MSYDYQIWTDWRLHIRNRDITTLHDRRDITDEAYYLIVDVIEGNLDCCTTVDRRDANVWEAILQSPFPTSRGCKSGSDGRLEGGSRTRL